MMQLMHLKRNDEIISSSDIRFYVIGYLDDESRKKLNEWRKEVNLRTILLTSLHVTLLKSTVSHYTKLGRPLIDNKLKQHNNMRLLDLHQKPEFTLKPKWEYFANNELIASKVDDDSKLNNLRNSLINKLVEEGLKRPYIKEESLHLTFAQKPFERIDVSKPMVIKPIDFPLKLESISFCGKINPI